MRLPEATGSRLSRRLRQLCIVALWFVATPALAGNAAPPSADHLEPGRQGEVLPGDGRVLPEPYSRNVRVIGHSPIYGRTGNMQLAWIGNCAYVSSSVPGIFGAKDADSPTSGLAVIDVSDPRAPREVRLLRDKGSILATETIHAVTAGNRKVLVAGAYGRLGKHDPYWLDIYDASDCTNPRLMAEVQWPEYTHTVTISPNGLRVYGTNQLAWTGHGGLQVLDISDMAHPRFIGKLGATGPDGRTWEFDPHEVSISPDERRIYAGVTDSMGGDLNPGVPEGPSMERISPEAGGIYILDNSDIVEGRPNPKLRLIGTVPHGGWHSVMQANIGGVPYLVGGGELVGCPGAFPKIVNIADESHPYIAGEFRLEMNHPENCGTAAAGMAGLGAPAATLHFNDVDSATSTHYGLFNFTAAGLRIADLSDPRHPVEAGYFRPGDTCTGHVRYLPGSGQIWFTCAASGVWVIELARDH